MRTTLDIEDDLVGELMSLTNASTKAEAVRCAIAEYIRMKAKQRLLALRGQWELVDNWQELRGLDTEPLEEEVADE